MPISCFGDAQRQNLVDTYEVQPISHCTLLEGQTRRGCARPLTREYYIFQATHRSTQQVETFYAGRDSGPAILTLLGHAPLPLTDPFPSIANGAEAQNQGGAHAVGVPAIVNQQNWTQINVQLNRAIDLTCMLWDTNPRGLFKLIKQSIFSNPQEDIDPYLIENFNNALRRFNCSIEAKLLEAAARAGRTAPLWNFRELENMVAWTGESYLFPSQAPGHPRPENVVRVLKIEAQQNFARCEMLTSGWKLIADLSLFDELGGPVPNQSYNCYIGYRKGFWKVTRVVSRAQDAQIP
ncbi:hypothetical protein [Brucella oryzae]|uniref:hypothetical protein n=1 Tax=Brucella oryzae TaxID=335286 RepID=UPI0035BC49EA